jgi:hypothetical protein
MWLISLAAVKGGPFLQRTGRASSTSSPLVLQASNLIRSLDLRYKFPLCYQARGLGAWMRAVAPALRPPRGAGADVRPAARDGHSSSPLAGVCPTSRLQTGGGAGQLRGRTLGPRPAGRTVRRRGDASLTGEAGQMVMRMQTVGQCLKGGFNINSFGVETEGRLRLGSSGQTLGDSNDG